MKNFDPSIFIKQLCSIGERQLAGESAALEMIGNVLIKFSVDFQIDKFTTYVPRFISSRLTVDGKRLPSMPTSFVSGKIEGKYDLISSLISSQRFLYDRNINFNPHCRSISRGNHYFAPAVAISSHTLSQVNVGKKISVQVKVKKVIHRSANVFIGNTKNPEIIIFSHYDSIGPGAVDNASGVALSLDLAINHPGLLMNCLFVIAGNEELSYDQPIYWGKGYREFEKKHHLIMDRSRRIIVVDCIGHSRPEIIKDIEIVRLGFPVSSLEGLSGKTRMVSGSMDKLMEFYHSDLDVPNKIRLKFYLEAKSKVFGLIKNKAK